MDVDDLGKSELMVGEKAAARLMEPAENPFVSPMQRNPSRQMPSQARSNLHKFHSVVHELYSTDDSIQTRTMCVPSFLYICFIVEHPR